jgi:hypothetical protein
MALPSTAPIKISEIQTEYGATSLVGAINTESSLSTPASALDFLGLSNEFIVFEDGSSPWLYFAYVRAYSSNNTCDSTDTTSNLSTVVSQSCGDVFGNSGGADIDAQLGVNNILSIVQYTDHTTKYSGAYFYFADTDLSNYSTCTFHVAAVTSGQSFPVSVGGNSGTLNSSGETSVSVGSSDNLIQVGTSSLINYERAIYIGKIVLS